MRWLAALVAGMLVVGCMPLPGTGPVLHGRLSLPVAKARLRTAMTPEELVSGATVSLIRPDNSTAAVGLTDANGAFTLTVPAPENGVFRLIAAKRADGDGRLLQLSTLVSYDGTNWTSISDSLPDVIINPTTTAVTLVGDAMTVMPADWLRKVSRDADTNEYTVVDPSFAVPSGTSLDTTVALIAEHVATLADLDVDPLRGVCFIGSAMSDGASPVQAATAGATRIKVTGFGFDPVPERNSVGIQVGRQFYWTPALPGSTDTILYARVPAVPPSDSSSGAMSVPVHVRNGVGALEVNIDAPPSLALQTARAVPDIAAVLPDPGAPRFASMAVGPLSGYVNWSWPDGRFGSVSPILRIWNLTGNVLANMPPQVANSTAPNYANDPGFFTQALVQEQNGSPMQIRTHVIWQGRYVLSGLSAIFHRWALNGVWQTYNGAGGPTASTSIPLIGGDNSQDCTSPASLMDGSRIFCAFAERYTTGRYNIKTRVWNGTFRNGLPDWYSNSVPSFLTVNGASATTAKLPQVAMSTNSATSTSMYHVLWHNVDPNSPTTGSLQYRRGTVNNAGLASVSASAVVWDPPTATNQPATWQANVGDLSDLTLATDTTGNALAVWLVNGALTYKSIASGLPTSAIAGVTPVAVPALPGGAQEASPRLVAVGTDDFYLISASTTATAAEAAEEIWLRRWHGGQWTGPVRLSNSPGVTSSQPLLHWNGVSLTAGWQEGATMVYELVIMPI
jgi:hypothetical protein